MLQSIAGDGGIEGIENITSFKHRVLVKGRFRLSQATIGYLARPDRHDEMKRAISNIGEADSQTLVFLFLFCISKECQSSKEELLSGCRNPPQSRWCLPCAEAFRRRGTPTPHAGTVDIIAIAKSTQHHCLSAEQTHLSPLTVLNSIKMSIQKVALITASSAGLGAQVARVLAPDFRVVSTIPSVHTHRHSLHLVSSSQLTLPKVINYSTNQSRAQSLITELSSIPTTHPSPTAPRFHLLQADVSSKSSVESLVQETIKTMGRLDVVVSNAGWTRMTNFLDINEGVNEDDWDKCFVMNVKTHLWLAYAAKDALSETEGTFITTASVAGVKPSGSSLPYAVTKAAQIHLAKGLAVILAPRIRVNSVSPGMMLTEWGLKFPESKRQKAIDNTKLKRLATVEDVADQIRTLVLSRSVTGQNLCIDGGSSI